MCVAHSSCSVPLATDADLPVAVIVLPARPKPAGLRPVDLRPEAFSNVALGCDHATPSSASPSALTTPRAFACSHQRATRQYASQRGVPPPPVVAAPPLPIPQEGADLEALNREAMCPVEDGIEVELILPVLLSAEQEGPDARQLEVDQVSGFPPQI